MSANFISTGDKLMDKMDKNSCLSVIYLLVGIQIISTLLIVQNGRR